MVQLVHLLGRASATEHPLQDRRRRKVLIPAKARSTHRRSARRQSWRSRACPSTPGSRSRRCRTPRRMRARRGRRPGAGSTAAWSTSSPRARLSPVSWGPREPVDGPGKADESSASVSCERLAGSATRLDINANVPWSARTVRSSPGIRSSAGELARRSARADSSSALRGAQRRRSSQTVCPQRGERTRPSASPRARWRRHGRSVGAVAGFVDAS